MRSQTHCFVLSDNSLNLGLEDPLEEPRPDLRFRRRLLAPLRHTLRAQKLPLILLTPLLSTVFGQLLLWQDTFGQFNKSPELP